MGRWSSLPWRTFSGLFVLAYGVLAFIMDGWFLYSAIALLSVLGIFEVSRALAISGVGKQAYFNGALSLAFLVCALLIGEQAILPVLMIGILVIIVISLFRQVSDFKLYALSIFGFIYPSIFFTYLMLVAHIEHKGVMLTAFIITTLVVAATDVFAYFIGVMFGKTPLCPSISPKKTVEGALGGIVAAILMALALGIIIPSIKLHNPIDIPLWHFAILGLVCGILGECGNLLASLVKRNAGIKDYAGLLPGMGGIMDRLDGIIFASVFVFYYFTLILGK